jgi:hypothetical protein
MWFQWDTGVEDVGKMTTYVADALQGKAQGARFILGEQPLSFQP